MSSNTDCASKRGIGAITKGGNQHLLDPTPRSFTPSTHLVPEERTRNVDLLTSNNSNLLTAQDLK